MGAKVERILNGLRLELALHLSLSQQLNMQLVSLLHPVFAASQTSLFAQLFTTPSVFVFAIFMHLSKTEPQSFSLVLQLAFALVQT